MELDANLRNVELHLHLDGAARPQTLFELARKRQIVTPYSTVEELRQALLPVRPYSLKNFLKGFPILLELVAGDRVCPSSSWLTGAVIPDVAGSHPVCRFAADGFNFSLNTDAPLMTSRWLFDEFTFCMTSLGLTGADLRRSRVNAAGAAFLDDEQQREMLLRHALG
ncbi:adenosine deaminase [Paragonimus westermani]|uniref:adenosine deaminase n=1 Tax=Paragonimus westermani TaxID=34504 RepID=A0A5J4NE00_9TREM|nr:adenosine deaminase [Paragonimus westermani]